MAAIVAFVATVLVVALLLPLAPRLGLIDLPQGRKDHMHPTPVVGGIAMLTGSATAMLFVPGESPSLWAFMSAACVIVAVGIYDDRHDLRWFWRLGVQILAALFVVYWGGVRVQQVGPLLGVQSTGLGFLSVPFTVFATVGLINAMNMIDGCDGLAGSLAFAALAMLCAAAMYAGNLLLADRTLVVAAAVAGFLLWNLRFPWRGRARTFMGDAGSGFLGLVIAWVAFRLTQNPGHPVSPVLALWLLPIPVMDCLSLIVRRLQEKRSPFAAGRDHIHHLMADAGYSPMQVVLSLTSFSLLVGLLAAISMRIDVPDHVLFGAYLAMCVGWYLLTRRRERAVRFFVALRGARRAAETTEVTESGS
ncbi:MraY family glycosyltransferase [Thermomonas sp. HDW16]|uniref:MraY family glycosyltransferase n=1 Tax=Thermomonas sp. HDW16 TaxID=2714945 RepID=UPI0014077753|nr:MraY family glycosyltransferase [Thermomonas sp. HDW16]QIL20535.1 undecaprenyl/decaprenyl-phosphate alpha-N-acetylglucosaminyl 1-phosphate transferase [Thermomonas sp. HDW16]